MTWRAVFAENPSVKLTYDQRRALLDIGSAHPAPFVEVNNWASGNSLIRKGLATKTPTADPLTRPPEFESAWAARQMRLPRATFRLTEAGLDAWRKWLRAHGFMQEAAYTER